MSATNPATATTYNGWTNYETWNVKLWIDNDESEYDHWQDRARELSTNVREEKPFTKQESAIYALAQELKDAVTEKNPIDDASLYADLLNAALSEVNWQEIAKALINELE